MAKDTLTIVDNRTDLTYTIPISQGAVRAMDLRQIKTGPDDFGLMTYDPAFMNTASCRSAITYLDGDRGILRYRGYPIEQLAENCTFLEVAYLCSTASSRRPWSSTAGAPISSAIRWSTRTSKSSWTASTMTRTPWVC